MECKKHPRFTGKSKPTGRKNPVDRTCRECWSMYYIYNRIPFNPQTMKNLSKVHQRYYQLSGQQVQGITTIISNQNGNSGGLVYAAWELGLQGIDYKEEWRYKADAGTIAHEMVRCYLFNIKHNFNKQYPGELVRQGEIAFQGFLEWKAQFEQFETILCEEPLVSEVYPYGATLDWYGLLNGKKTLVDFKTGKAIYWNHKVQVAGQAKLLEEHGHDVERVRILHMVKGEEGIEDAAPQFFDYPQSGLTPYWQWFTHIVQANPYYNQIVKGWD